MKKHLSIREEKNKFLNKFTKDNLLEKALFMDFTHFLTDDLVQNTQVKIKKSNFNKANEVLKELIALLASVTKNNFEPLYQQLVQEVDHATDNLNNTLRATKNKMQSEVNKTTRNFKNKTREVVYSKIDTNISDDSLKNKLESIIKIQYEQVQKDLPIALEKELKIFQCKINKVMKNFNRRVNHTIQEFKGISFDTNDSNFHINLNLNNGIDGMGVMGNLAGAGGLAYAAITAGNSWNPLGWTMFAIGVVTVLVSFGKSIYKIFSNDYKKSEQRKSANKNIDRITEKIEKSILEKLDLSFLEFEKITEDIINNLDSGVEQVKKANDYITDLNIKLLKLSQNIHIEGAIQ
jgi:hypothetical protein